MPPDGFAALILTHGRPDNVKTLRTLERSGYTGPVFLVVDDEDTTLPQYREAYGDQVVTFSKADIAARFDEADNFGDRRSIFYARNASFEIAQRLGFTYFIQLDDDYTAFSFRSGPEQTYGTWNITCLDEVFGLLLDYFKGIPAATLCFCQGGDFIGGLENKHVRDVTFKRKAMNTFICSTERPFRFVGRINEDVNTYVESGRRGVLFMTLMGVQIVQINTQQGSGGMTDLYLDAGTYLKSFYSVVIAPSCVKVAEMGEVNRRLHHRVSWNAATPMILREGLAKPDTAYA
ncbi:MAG TPA: hypothetical protein VKA61_02345 [Sphingomicrobium sp.]|nr:hypothetical protein [Sphingomicrobium sp.]